MKIFIAGPRAINDLDNNIEKKLNNICEKEYDVIVGDADGIDSSVQKFLNRKKYKNVTIYASKGVARNNYGNWEVKNIPVDKKVTGFEFYATKDLSMAKNADVGMMIWDGESRGTFNNIINLLKLEKVVILYYIPTRRFYKIAQMKELHDFINSNVKLNNKLRKILPQTNEPQFVQAYLF